MSGALLGLTGAAGLVGAAAGGTVQDALSELTGVTLKRPRMVDTLVPHMMAEEVHYDEMAVTDHPVERGTPISDHAYLLPKKLLLKMAWSNSSQFETLGEDYIDQVYDELLALQAAREPFTVMTGKRLYENMVIESVGVTTDERSENILSVVARLREVMIVTTQTVSTTPREEQAEPENTEQPAERGEVQPQETATPSDGTASTASNTSPAAETGGSQGTSTSAPSSEYGTGSDGLPSIGSQDSAPRPSTATTAPEGVRQDLGSFRDQARASLNSGYTGRVLPPG